MFWCMGLVVLFRSLAARFSSVRLRSPVAVDAGNESDD